MKDDAIATKLVQDWAEKKIETPAPDNYDYDAVKQEVATHLEDFISDAISRTGTDCEALADNGKQEVVDEVTDNLGELLDRILGDDKEGILEVLQNADVRSRIYDVQGCLQSAVDEQIESQLESNIVVQAQGWKSISITLEVEPTFVMSRPYSKDPWGLVAFLERLYATASEVAERVKSERLPQRMDAAFARLREAVLAAPFPENGVQGFESYVKGLIAGIEESARALRERRVELPDAKVCAYCRESWPCNGSAYQAPENQLHRQAAGEQGLPTLDPVGDAVADAILNDLNGKGV